MSARKLACIGPPTVIFCSLRLRTIPLGGIGTCRSRKAQLTFNLSPTQWRGGQGGPGGPGGPGGCNCPPPPAGLKNRGATQWRREGLWRPGADYDMAPPPPHPCSLNCYPCGGPDSGDNL